MLHQLKQAMFAYYAGDARRVQHYLKVHAYASYIGTCEQLDSTTQAVLEAAALVHDIGIKPAECKFGACGGKLQEQEGGAPARDMLQAIGFAPDCIDRVVYLVEHHHTYTNVQGLDYRILLEADFLVNAYEDALPLSAICAGRDHIFATATGTALCNQMYGIGE